MSDLNEPPREPTPPQSMTPLPAPPRSPPMDYAPPAIAPPPRRSPFQNFARFTGGVIAGFTIVFIPTFFAGGEAFEGSLPRWAWPAVIAAALLCAAYAWRTRRRNPSMSAGVWVGMGLCLMLAGACFMGM
jgi:hypothetical protein